MPTLNLFWHAPLVAQYPKAPYNIIGLSRWACNEFKRVYHQKARYQQSIALDTSIYKLSHTIRNGRFLSLGVLTPRKGHLEAAMLCKKLGVPLDIVGKPYGGEYESKIRQICDGKQIRYLGEVDEAEKVKLMQECKALLFVNQEPEVTSHKVQECMLCGTPIITTSIGALPEIITQNVDGYLCKNETELEEAMGKVHLLNPLATYEATKSKYSIETVVKNYIPLYEEVMGGARWQ